MKTALDNSIELDPTPLVWTSSQILEIIEDAEEHSYIIDAGCHQGRWKQTMNYFIGQSVKTIGIDMTDHGCHHMYDFFIEAALHTVEEEREAFLFAESAVNSLYDRRDGHCYDAARFFERAGTKKVKTLRLDTVLDSIGNVDEIHYIKIDCQGNDVNIVKSLGDYAAITNYIQVETTFDDECAYTVSCNYLDDIEEMEKLGFRPIFHSPVAPRPDLQGLPAEGEILFINKRLGK